jgi:hypothetical protein
MGTPIWTALTVCAVVFVAWVAFHGPSFHGGADAGRSGVTLAKADREVRTAALTAPNSPDGGDKNMLRRDGAVPEGNAPDEIRSISELPGSSDAGLSDPAQRAGDDAVFPLFSSLSPQQQARIMQRCKEVLTAPLLADSNKLTVCRAVNAMGSR